MRATASRHLLAFSIVSFIVSACLGGRPGPDAATPAAASGDASAAPSGQLLIWSFPQGDDEVPIKEYIKRFQERYPQVTPRLVVVAEETYSTRINTALEARNPPDIAIIEDQRWMKAGRVVDIAPRLGDWGVDVEELGRGGVTRMTIRDGDVDSGLFGIGDFLGGNILVYNKKLLDEGGVEYPPLDRSLTIHEYAEICRATAKVAAQATQTVYGCSVAPVGFGFVGREVWGEDGRNVMGNLNSPEMAEAFEVGAALINEKVAPGSAFLETVGESDLFAQGKIAITWTDFTEIPKYQEAGIDFGLAPYWVIHEGLNMVDTWTAPWGTFTDSKNPAAALAFLQFIATDAQHIRPEITADPPLNVGVAEEVGYGDDDPVKKQYLEVLKLSEAQVFVPNGVEAFNADEVIRVLTVEGETDAQPILDEMAEETQRELDEVWEDWDALGG